MSAMPIDRSLDNPTSAGTLGMGFFGASDAELQERQEEALRTAAIRRNAAVVGGAVSGISENEMTASEIRLANSLRTEEMQDYFTYSPVGQIERAGFEGLAQASGGYAMSRLAGVVPSMLGRAAPPRLASTVGAANRRIGEVSQNIYYPGRAFNKAAGGNYAMKSVGSPTGMAMGGFDDLPFLGGALDLNRIRYTLTNPGVYLSKLMVGEARELTGRKREPPPEITGPMTEEEARMYTDYGQ